MPAFQTTLRRLHTTGLLTWNRSFMKSLLEGIEVFQRKVFPEHEELFADLATGQSRILADDRPGEVQDLLFTPDARLVAACPDGLWLFHVTDGSRQCIREGEVTDVDASRDGHIVTSSRLGFP